VTFNSVTDGPLHVGGGGWQWGLVVEAQGRVMHGAGGQRVLEQRNGAGACV
jgi:hypothetical protein